MTQWHALYQSSQAKPSSQRTSRTFTGQRSTDYSVPARQVMAPRHSKIIGKFVTKYCKLMSVFGKFMSYFHREVRCRQTHNYDKMCQN